MTSEETWSNAENYCKAFSSHLVDIRDVNEANFVYGAVIMAMGEGTNFWIGLNDLADDLTYVYTSGASVTYTNYAAGEPSEIVPEGREDCIEIMNGGLWNDELCENLTKVSVCEKIHY